jgi:photosystem II stability/assembly factor-like uncharacterized protein
MKTVVLILSAAGCLMAQSPSPSWTVQESGTTVSLRGISAVNAKVAWASGGGGTYLRTIDGGATWKAAKVPGASDVDFRAVRAFDDKTAFLLSIGNGEKSRIYRTEDGGERWQLLYTNPDPKGFFDALAFWDADHGIVLGDPVDGHFVVMTTENGGQSWHAQKTPAALPKEGAFAASNSCLTVQGAHQVWFGTGGPGGARVFHSTDAGQTWTVSKTPIRNDGASAGIFSLAFSDTKRGIALGGDYNKAAETTGVVALTSDGGKTWIEPSSPRIYYVAPDGRKAEKGGRVPPSGFRSDVKYLALAKMWIAAGTSGSDYSLDNGNSWKPFDSGNYNAIGLAPGGAWAVGPKGAIAKFKIE